MPPGLLPKERKRKRWLPQNKESVQFRNLSCKIGLWRPWIKTWSWGLTLFLSFPKLSLEDFKEEAWDDVRMMGPVLGRTWCLLSEEKAYSNSERKVGEETTNGQQEAEWQVSPGPWGRGWNLAEKLAGEGNKKGSCNCSNSWRKSPRRGHVKRMWEVGRLWVKTWVTSPRWRPERKQ